MSVSKYTSLSLQQRFLSMKLGETCDAILLNRTEAILRGAEIHRNLNSQSDSRLVLSQSLYQPGSDYFPEDYRIGPHFDLATEVTARGVDPRELWRVAFAEQ